MCVMSVVSVMRGLYLIEQTLEIIDCSDENTSCHVMSNNECCEGPSLLIRSLKIIDTSNKTLFSVLLVLLSVL